MTPKSAIAELEKLVNSPGWKVVEEQMRAELVEAAMQIATGPSLSQQELDFRRGAIWAATKLLNVPHLLKSKLENEIALEKLNVPAKAGKQEPKI